MLIRNGQKLMHVQIGIYLYKSTLVKSWHAQRGGLRTVQRENSIWTSFGMEKPTFKEPEAWRRLLFQIVALKMHPPP